jgi:multisubunit Na+/H+ antiporter MnhE subunit
VKKIIQLGLLWAFFILLWLLFVCQLNVKEVLAGSLAAVLAFIPLWLSHRAERIVFQPELRWLLEVRHLPMEIIRGCGILLRQLGRALLGKPSESTFLVAPFHCATDKHRRTAQRALAITLTTVPPNSLVVGIDTETELILFHQLKKTPVPAVIRRIEG